ncbi:acetate kinase [Synechococcus sp. PROS-7-1]|uniref:acetate/propionate family kinase n=1 Tax=Synechococcus sp. PROS-7-1 TaxID=1442556 RepID=UPI0016495BAD|nr:acetate kinase [Synechococcus sp. PROS-7-1]QNI84071.1 acetate kinase [Synechococcus sp. PROS-7-1]
MQDLALVINLGSSSLKAALVDSTGASPWHSGRSLQPEESLDGVLSSWLAPELAPYRQGITLVGHRVVHGGEHFTAPTRIDAAVETTLQELVPLAPLHNPPALKGLAWARGWAPDLPQWACFDTAFHSTLPEAASTYALPADLRQRGFRRFGFHGINHQHVAETVAAQWRQQGRDLKKLRLISAHLGAGASLAAIKGGVCIDTTMGYTPLEGLVMASRSGSVDPGLLLELMREGMGEAELADLLQKQAGLKGLSGLSGDMRDIREQAAAGHQGAQLALGVFRQRLLQLIGAMAASLRGVDVLALTGGIGEHDQALQAELAEALAWLPNLEMVIVPADEEGMIARLCRRSAAVG